jgi:DNA integrity scanning protein DisA with diadenylate cyclase activity/mannitol/fructose-specific phosphotransferase system IIA component (Ntr-type)
MRLDRYLAKTRIVDLQSTEFSGALDELLRLCPLTSEPDFNPDEILDALIEREQTMTTCLDNGIALPHIRIPMKRPYVFAVGRCPLGVDYEGLEEYKNIRLIFLLLASDKEKSYLNVLASLARVLQDPMQVDSLVESPDLKSFRDRLLVSMGGPLARGGTRITKFNRLIFKEAEKIAKGADCNSVMIMGDTFEERVDMNDHFHGFKKILVASSMTAASQDAKHLDAIIPTRSFGRQRLSSLRSAILIGLTRGVLKYNDRICCVGGLPKSNRLDSVVVVDLEREFQSVFTRQGDILPPSVKPEVLERVLAIALELAVEGREGRPVGSLFVVGDTEHVKPFTKPLVLNPFYGYKEEDRNILNPFMDETIKEFSSIDGGFIIREDGVIESAGTYIHAPDHHYELPSGLGTRHSAGAAISLATECIAVVISSSSGQVTLFRRGKMLPLIEKSADIS